MPQRKYYSARKNPQNNQLSFESFKTIFFSIWQDFKSRGYFQEYFGIDCTDGFIPGHMGENIQGYFLRKMRKPDLWPFAEKFPWYSDDDIFDMIEFFFDHISCPLEEESNFHSWNQCGWHFHKFDQEKGRNEFRSKVNQFLSELAEGYELTEKGEIVRIGPNELRPLFSAKIPAKEKSIKDRMIYAAEKFRNRGSSIDERTESVRALADCLEYLRPQIKTVLNKQDEKDLFEIANNFAIRHFNKAQKTDYDKPIWLSWMFYFYYSTLLACLNLIEKPNQP